MARILRYLESGQYPQISVQWLIYSIAIDILYYFHRGSYMSAHVLLILLNELGKRDKMRGLPSILSLLCNEFNKFNNTRAQTIYHMTLSVKTL